MLSDAEAMGRYSHGILLRNAEAVGRYSLAYVVMAHVLRDVKAVGRYSYGLCSYGLCAEGHLGHRDGKLLNIEARQGHCVFDGMQDSCWYACRHVSRPVCRHLYRHVHGHSIVL